MPFSLSKCKSLWVLSLLVMLAVTACSKPKSSDDYLTQARQDRHNGDDKAAIIDLKNALQKDPKNGEARVLLAQILNDHGEGSAAEIELRKAMDLGVKNSEIMAAMGRALLLQQQYLKVIDTISVIEGVKGEVAADIYNVRGEAYLNLNRIAEAQSAFDNALKEYPDSADAYLGKGRLAALRHDMNGALQQMDIALSKDPKSTRAWMMKASLLMTQGQYEEAKSAYGRVLQINKDDVSAHLGLASVDMAQSKLDAAKTEIEAALNIAPKALAPRYALAQVLYQQGKFKEAQEAIQEVLKAVPDNIPSVLIDGATALALGSYEQALSDLDRVIGQYPDNAYARRLLAAAQIKLGKMAPAMETLRPLLNAQTGDAQALALAGEAQLREKNYSKASEYLQRALELNPAQAPKLRTQLAIGLLGAGDTTQALVNLEQASKGSNGQSLADSILITIYLRQKEFDQALTAIASLEKKLGPNPVTSTLRGTALLGKQDVAGARKAFEQALSIQPTFFQAAANLAQLDMRAGKPDAAIERFKAILNKDGNNVQAMLALAELAASQKQEQAYVHWLIKAKEAQPNIIFPYVKLVDFYIAKKDTGRALGIADEAAKAYPASTEALALLAATQLAVGDYEKSLKVARQLQTLQPGSPIGYDSEANVLMAQKQYGQAAAAYDQALDRGAGSVVLIKLHRALLGANNDKAAEQRLTSWLDRNPDDVVVRNYAAEYLMVNNRDGAAIKQYETILKLTPTNLQALNNLAILYQRERMDGRALDTAEKALKLVPQDPALEDTLGWILLQQGQLNRAKDLLQQAASKQPGAGTIHYHLAVVLSRTGQKAEAKRELQAAIGVGASFPELADAKAMLKGMSPSPE